MTDENGFTQDDLDKIVSETRAQDATVGIVDNLATFFNLLQQRGFLRSEALELTARYLESIIMRR